MPDHTGPQGVMDHSTVIVGVEPSHREHLDAIALGATLARVSHSSLVLVSVYEPRHAAWRSLGASYEHALNKAVVRFGDRLDGLGVEQLVLPGASAARVLHNLADQRSPYAVVVGSSPRAPWGQVELGNVSERVLHGGGARTVLAPRGYVSNEDRFDSIGVGLGGTPESDDALCTGVALARQAGAALRVITVFDPADYIHALGATDGPDELRLHAEHTLDDAVRGADDARVTGELLDGDPGDVLTRLSSELDLLVLGSRSYGPLRAVLLGGVSGALVHRAVCPLMIVPHRPDPAHEVTLVGGLEASYTPTAPDRPSWDTP